MAIVELAPALTALRGRSGNAVYRTVRGTTVLASRPSIPKRRKRSEAQVAQQNRFRDARWYARKVLADPWQRLIYEQLAEERNRRADHLAVSDFLTPPVVEAIDASAYRREPGGLIRVLATDDIEVVSVEIAIHAAGGALIERGHAARDHGVWRYVTTAIAPATEPLTITAIAKDRPGHPGEKSVAYT